MKKIIILSIILGLLVLTLTQVRAIEPIVEGNRIVEIWGVLRPDADGNWYAIENGVHTHHNIATVSQTDQLVKVDYSETLSKIHYSSITPDETMVVSDLAVGGSVGSSYALVNIAKSGSRVDPGTLSSSVNFWFYVRGEANGDEPAPEPVNTCVEFVEDIHSQIGAYLESLND